MTDKESKWVRCEFVAEEGTGQIVLSPIFDSHNRQSMRAITLDAKAIREMMDAFARDYFKAAMEETGLGDRVETILSRAIDVAVKAVVPKIERAVEDEMRKQITARVAAAVAAMPIEVSVKIGGA